MPAAITFGACDAEHVGNDSTLILLLRVGIAAYCEDAVSPEEYEMLALSVKSADGL